MSINTNRRMKYSRPPLLTEDSAGSLKRTHAIASRPPRRFRQVEPGCVSCDQWEPMAGRVSGRAGLSPGAAVEPPPLRESRRAAPPSASQPDRGGGLSGFGAN